MIFANLPSLHDALLTLVFPQACVICHGSVERHGLGVACADCWASTRLISDNDPICWKCGTLAFALFDPSKKSSVRCGGCDELGFAFARACGLYEKALRETILTLKRQPHLPASVAELLSVTASRAPLSESTLIVPVPLHVDRQKSRGFNQAMVIAAALSKSAALPINNVGLIRTAQAVKYRAGLDVKGRSDTVAGAFQVVHPQLVANEKILLVDDVFTTGATAAACSTALVQAGAQVVNVLTIARTAKWPVQRRSAGLSATVKDSPTSK